MATFREQVETQTETWAERHRAHGRHVSWKHSGFDHDPASPIDDDEAREAFRALRGDLEEAS